jgi:hypothetical protein
MPTTIPVQPGQTLSISGGVPNISTAIQTASVVVGSSTTNVMTVTATGIWTWNAPLVGTTTGVQNVWLQARQSSDDNNDNNFSDEFALQFVMWQNAGPNNLQVTFTITRVDILFDNTPPIPEIGWGQNLQVDIMLVTSPIPIPVTPTPTPPPPPTPPTPTPPPPPPTTPPTPPPPTPPTPLPPTPTPG